MGFELEKPHYGKTGCQKTMSFLLHGCFGGKKRKINTLQEKKVLNCAFRWQELLSTSSANASLPEVGSDMKGMTWLLKNN